jgi:NADP-dependent 3-hydroxy acid dehydrogenase YdfG
MLKVAITGHTQGIGRALTKLMERSYVVHVFSRSNGYDITKDVDAILEQAQHCDIFVNNAYDGFAQVKLFDNLYALWKDNADKTIVNIGSRAKYSNNDNQYTRVKRELAAAADNANIYDRKCRICNINPGWVQTSRTKQMLVQNQDPSITATECARYILWAIEQPIEIAELSLWKI